MDVDEASPAPVASGPSEVLASTARVRELSVTQTLPELSVLIPAFNEVENLASVIPELCDVLHSSAKSFEVIVIDDGSTDGTRGLMHTLSIPELRYIRFRRNSGKAAALAAGLARAKGEVVAFMDADGQDDPNEIPKLVSALDADVDLVSGRRAVRHDRFVKRWTSRIYNRTTAIVTGITARDMNTGLKVMRRVVAQNLELYGELHRYVPVLAAWSGFRSAEVDIVHRSRISGNSKYGPARFVRGMLDLLTVKFLTTYTGRPLHLFGVIGGVLGVGGASLLAWMTFLRFTGERVGDRPALLVGVLLVVVAVQMISLGLLAELIVSLRRRANLEPSLEEDALPH
jgi:glycosyltransferase involved in cell wall biosynthesis